MAGPILKDKSASITITTNIMTTTCTHKPAGSEKLRAMLAEHLATRTTTTTQPDSRPADPGPFARTLDEFVKPMGNDPAELLKHRYLCRGGGLLLVGPTGHGKSSLAMQLMIKWALGQ